MISMLVIVGLFGLAVVGLSVLGRHVENPADRDVTVEDRLGIFRNEIASFGRKIGQEMISVLQEIIPTLRAVIQAFDELGEAMGRAAASMKVLIDAYGERADQ